MRRKTAGWFFTVTGFLACPCHLVITLPLAMTVLSGTALGGWIGTHEGAVTLGATLYFVGALTLGAPLLLTRTSQARLASQAAQQACNPACERDSTGSRGGTQMTTPWEHIRTTCRSALRDKPGGVLPLVSLEQRGSPA